MKQSFSVLMATVDPDKKQNKKKSYSQLSSSGQMIHFMVHVAEPLCLPLKGKKIKR